MKKTGKPLSNSIFNLDSFNALPIDDPDRIAVCSRPIAGGDVSPDDPFSMMFGCLLFNSSATADSGKVGQRYVQHKANGTTFHLFARDYKIDPETGVTMPYLYGGE